MTRTNGFEKFDGLILIDVQRDFCPGGALAVPDGEKIIPVLNDYIKTAREAGSPVYASRDWHPVCHVSFREKGGDWPPHCIQDSEGAAFHPDLKLPDNVVKITKGVRFDKDQNSIFDETGFARQLRRDGVERLWVGGLALDVCVLESVVHAREDGFAVNLIRFGTRPVKPKEEGAVLEKMRGIGVKIR